MALAIRRFDFDGLQDFRAPPPPAPAANDHTLPEAEDFAPPPPPSFSEDELNAAKASAWEEGHNAGVKAEAERQATDAKKREEAIVTALSAIIDLAQKLQKDYTDFKAHQTRELGALVMLLVRKVAGDVIAAAPTETIDAMINECLPVLQNEPKIVAQVHPDLFTHLEQRLRELSESHHLDSTITLKANPKLAPGEALLDWSTGSAERRTEDLFAQVETIIAAMDFSQLAQNSSTDQLASEVTTTEQPSDEQGDNNE